MWCHLTRDQSAALQEITVEEYTERRGKKLHPVKRVKIKLNDQLEALNSLARHLGMFIDRSESMVWDGDMSSLTDEQLKNLLAQFGKLAGIEPPKKAT